MLVIRRREGQWIDVVHGATGDMVRIRVNTIRRDYDVSLGFDDPDWNFEITRPKSVKAEVETEEQP